MKEERRFSWKTISLLLLAAGLLYVVFASRELMQWSRSLSSLQGRVIFSRLLSLPEKLADTLGAAEWLGDAKTAFHVYKDRSFDEWFRREAAEIAETEPAAETGGPMTPEDLSGRPGAGVPAPDPEEEFLARAAEEILFPEGRLIPPPEAPSAPKGRILIIGDSMANSCYRALVPIQRKFPDLKLFTYTRVSANLCNETFDQWFEDLEEYMAEKHFDTVLIILGANAVQPLTYKGLHYNYNTPEWIWFYKQKAADMLHKVKKPGTRVCWVGLPPMLGRSYRDNMVRHNQLLKEVCRLNEISFFPIEYILGDENGLYTDYKIISGRQIRVRDSDKIHYTAAGEALLAEYLVGELFPGYYAQGN